ncbi:hypothetical protein KY362_00725 [Candidatus Woesearchaeota archaeon]|nr:hypothetical protein [Candidatus Woesearchaeota archaeon]
MATRIPEWKSKRFELYSVGIKKLFKEFEAIARHMDSAQEDIAVFKKRYHALLHYHSKDVDWGFHTEFDMIERFFDGWQIRFSNAFLNLNAMDREVRIRAFFQTFDIYPGEEVLSRFRKVQSRTEVKDQDGRVIGKSKDIRRLHGHAKAILRHENKAKSIAETHGIF